MELKNPTKQRRSIGRVLTEDKICAELEHLSNAARSTYNYYKDTSPPIDSKEDERRKKAIDEAHTMMLAAGLAWLRVIEPSIYRAIIFSGQQYAKQIIEKKRGQFRIAIPKKPPSLGRILAKVNTPMVYRVILNRLRRRWSPPPDFPFRGHYVNKKGRYGEQQHLGNLKRHNKDRHRTQVIMKIASFIERGINRTVARSAGVLQRENIPTLTDSVARQWVLKLKTPPKIAHQILAFYMRTTPRQVKELMRVGRKTHQSPTRSPIHSQVGSLAAINRT